MSPIEEVVIEPSASSWRGLLAGWSIDDERAEARRQCGLPVDRPIVMSGHQASIWHAGILAKYLSAGSASRSFDAHAAWLIADQDVNNPWLIDYPVRDRERLVRRTWNAGRTGVTPGVPTFRQPPSRPSTLPDDADRTPARAGLERIADALFRHADVPNSARQFARAAADLARDLTQPPTFVHASDLHRFTSLQCLLDRMAADPDTCRRAYNEAVRSHPQARLRPLRPGELPIWLIGEDGRRHPGGEGDLGDHSSLAPRAIFATGFARLVLCDIFIHGIGGGRYEPAADTWFKGWLGRAPPAPHIVVTATLRLNLSDDAIPPPERLSRSVWLAHRALHDPAIVGDEAAAKIKQESLEAIRRARRGGDDPAPAFRRMHQALEDYRARNADRIRALSDQADRDRFLLRSAAVAYARDWPFPLHEPADLAALAARIDDEFRRASSP